MPEVISNTSPLLYLYRIGGLDWLPELFSEVSTPAAVLRELEEGRRRGYDVPSPEHCQWLKIIEVRSVPSSWLALDLGAGELAVLAAALEDPRKFVLLDDSLARRVAQAAGLTVWGTLRVLLAAKSLGLTGSLKPLLDRLSRSGMWISADVRSRVLALAQEKD